MFWDNYSDHTPIMYTLLSHTYIVSTHSVDQTITNILDGRVKFTSIPTLHEATGGGNVRVGAGNRSGSGDQGREPKLESGLFGGRKSRSAHLSLQRHMSLEERKKLLLEQARRYIDTSPGLNMCIGLPQCEYCMYMYIII